MNLLDCSFPVFLGILSFKTHRNSLFKMEKRIIRRSKEYLVWWELGITLNAFFQPYFIKQIYGQFLKDCLLLMFLL